MDMAGDNLERGGFLNIAKKIYNINTVEVRSPYIGGKNGFTDEANHTLVALFSVPVGSFNQRTFAVIILGSKNRSEDANKILSVAEEQTRSLSWANGGERSQNN